MVKRTIQDLIRVALKTETKVGNDGQAPGDSPDFAAYCVGSGIDWNSLKPDSDVGVFRYVTEVSRSSERAVQAGERS